MRAVVGYAQTHPDWIVRFLSVYLGNPLVFILYAVSMSNDTSGDGARVMGMRTFVTVSTNTSWMNPFLFVIITLPLYILWFGLQVGCIVPFLGRICCCCGGRRTFRVETFCARYAGDGSCIVAIPGLLNVFVWSTTGMEGNVMGFLFALPLLIAIIIYGVMWAITVVASLERSNDGDTYADEGLTEYEPVSTTPGISLPDL